jgi:hypothetical protein
MVCSTLQLDVGMLAALAHAVLCRQLDAVSRRLYKAAAGGMISVLWLCACILAMAADATLINLWLLYLLLVVIVARAQLSSPSASQHCSPLYLSGGSTLCMPQVRFL